MFNISSKTKKKRKVRRHHKWVDQLRDGDDAQSLRREHGHPWVGFCDRWAPLVADFRAGAARWGGAPVGLPIMMAQKLVVGGTYCDNTSDRSPHFHLPPVFDR